MSLDPCQTSKIELFAKTINDFQSLSTFAKSSILDVWQGHEYTSNQGIDFYVLSP